MPVVPSAADVALQALCTQYLRTPVVTSDGTTVTFTFSPALSAPELVTFADLQTMSHFGIPATITLAEFQDIKPDLATGKAFLGIANPTNAQAVAAEKSIIRVVGALLRS